MSGRLTISTKKSYCPWSSENEAKYQRAEEKQKQAKRKEEEKTEIARSRSQWDQLRNRNRPKSDDPSAIAQGHVNLFPAPTVSEGNQHEERKGSSRGIGLTSKEGDKTPFYLYSNSSFGNADLNEKERKKRDRMDPMVSFRAQTSSRESCEPESHPVDATTLQKDCTKRRKRRFEERDTSDIGSESSASSSYSVDKRRRKKKRKKEKRREERRREKKRHHGRIHEENAGQPKQPPTSIDELRRKRLEREREEQERQARLLHGSSFRNAGRYNDQFRKHI